MLISGHEREEAIIHLFEVHVGHNMCMGCHMMAAWEALVHSLHWVRHRERGVMMRGAASA